MNLLPGSFPASITYLSTSSSFPSLMARGLVCDQHLHLLPRNSRSRNQGLLHRPSICVGAPHAMSASSGLTPSDLDAMGEDDKREMMEMVETMQTRDSLRMYNGLVERCFRECVDNFRRKTLDANEEKCVSKCTEKFLKHSARVSMRFAVRERSMVMAISRRRADLKMRKGIGMLTSNSDANRAGTKCLDGTAADGANATNARATTKQVSSFITEFLVDTIATFKIPFSGPSVLYCLSLIKMKPHTHCCSSSLIHPS